MGRDEVDGPRLSSVVAWSSVPVHPARRALRTTTRVAGNLLVLALELLTNSFAGSWSTGREVDPLLDTFIELENVTVSGHGRSLPGVAYGEQPVTLTRDSATLMRGWKQTTLDLSDTRIVRAQPFARGWHGRKEVDSPWELVVRGSDCEVTIHGPWLSLALWATQVGWPEPD